MEVAEREDKARAAFLRAFEKLCPFIAGNPFVPHWPFPQQALFLGLHQNYRHQRGVFQCLYGGAAGGGKSDALLMGAAQYAWKHPDFSAIMFRRTHTDLAQPGALMDRAMEWWIPAGVRWDGSNKIFRFPNGAKVAMAYLSKPNDHHRYKSAEYQYTAWDELTDWNTATQHKYVGLSRVRRKAGSNVPLRTLSASNPGGPGHNWVKERFIDDNAPCHYVPASIRNNPYIDQEDYIEQLMQLHPTIREQLLNGDWSARDQGDYFRREWFGPFLDPERDTWPDEDCIRVRWWDLAASEREDAAFTSGVRMAKHRSGVHAIEHVRSFRATPGKRDEWIIQQAKLDGFATTVGLEIEPGSGGVAQFLALEKQLKAIGFRVYGARPKAELTDTQGKLLVRQPAHPTGKEGRAAPVASCLQRGYFRRAEGPQEECGFLSSFYGLDEGKDTIHQRDGLRMFIGPWTQPYLDVVEGFPDGPTCDEVDATSGAWTFLQTQRFGNRSPIVQRDKPKIASFDLHPVDRDVVEHHSELERGIDRRLRDMASYKHFTP
jgi:phage terminase large subunit-like protein